MKGAFRPAQAVRPPLITLRSVKGLNEKARLAQHQDSLLKGPSALFHRIANVGAQFRSDSTSRGASVQRFTLAEAKEREPGYNAAADRIGKRLKTSVCNAN